MLLHSRLRAPIAQPHTSPSKRLGSFNSRYPGIAYERTPLIRGSLPATHARTSVVVRKCLHLLAASLSYCNSVRSSRSWGAPPGRTGGGLPKRERATQCEPLQADPPGGRGNVTGVGARSAPTEAYGKRSAQGARWHMARPEFVRLTFAAGANHNRRFRAPAQAGAPVAGARFA